MSCYPHPTSCPDAGYPTPAPSCGCGGHNPGPFPPAPQYPVPGGPGGFPGGPYRGGFVPGFNGGDPWFPPVPMTQGQAADDVLRTMSQAIASAGQALGFQLDANRIAAGIADTAGKTCTGWKIDPDDATSEVQTCCTPRVGRRGGRFQVAGCIKVFRKYDPWAGRRPGMPNGTAVG